MRFGMTGAKTRAWFEIRPLGCRESAGSNLARSNEPLLSLPNQAGSTNRQVDRIHLYLFTADYAPVQRPSAAQVVSRYRRARNDYEFFRAPSLTFASRSSSLSIMKRWCHRAGVTGILPVIPCANGSPRLGRIK